MEELKAKIRKNILYTATENDAGESFAEAGLEELIELFAQQQQEDYQEVLDLELMKREEIHATGNLSPEQKEKFYRNVFRKELRKSIAEKRGKV